MGIWLKRLSYLAVLGFPLSVLGTRLGLFDFRVGFDGLKYTLFLSLAVLLVSVIYAFFKRRTDTASAKHAKLAAILCLLPVLGIGSQIVTAKSLPMIHNISTDTVSPPAFDKVAQIRTDKHNQLAYNAADLAALQQQAYPLVKTLTTTLSKSDAFNRALATAKKMGWEIVDENFDSGMIEATETTLLWGFKDDVAIRISEQGEQVAVDLHSVSRVGLSDLGANAKRIEKFLKAFAK